MFRSKEKTENKITKDESNWISDHKHKQCMSCSKKFTLVTRRHHCRNCGRLLCGDCSKNKWIIENEQCRVCDQCFDKLSNNKPIKQTNPYFHVLQKPNLFSLITTFEKSWIRSRYPSKYEKYKKQLLNPQKSENKVNDNSETPKIKASDDSLTEYNPLIVIQTGVLYINIMEAQGLPDCDTFTRPDGYCIFYVSNNDPCFGEAHKYSTKVHHCTYEPKWEEDETIVITNTTGKLVVELWDYDFGDADDYLGKVEIELSDLFLHFSIDENNSSIIDDWFEVDLADEWKVQKNKQMQKVERKKKKSLLQNETKTIYKNPHSAQLMRTKYRSSLNISDDKEADDLNGSSRDVYKRLNSMPLLSYDDVFDEDVIRGKCYIHLQLKLKASPYGHFISCFDPLLPPKPKRIPFDMNLFYGELNKLLVHITPVINSSQYAMDVLFWMKYVWAFVYLIMFAYCIFNPWFAVFWIQFRVLVFSCHSYVKQTVLSENGIGKSTDINLPNALHAFCIIVGLIPSLFATISSKNQELMEQNKQNSDDEGGDKMKTTTNVVQQSNVEQKEEEEEISMGAFSTIVGNKVIKVSGLKDNLEWYQELLVFINQTIEYIVQLFNWKYPSITSMIVIVLSFLCLISVLMRKTNFYQYQILVIGCSILAYFSKPIQFIQWVCFGISRWYYSYYCKHQKFKTEQAEIEQNKVTPLDNAVMNDDNLLFAKNESYGTKIKVYLYKMLDKMKVAHALAMDLVFGLIAFVKPIFQPAKIENETFAPVHRRVIRNSDGVIIGYSDESPTKKSPQKKSKTKTPNSKGIGSIFSFNHDIDKDDDSENDGRVQMNIKKKKKQLTKQPTLCRKTSLRKIENTANEKIDSMLRKLNSI